MPGVMAVRNFFTYVADNFTEISSARTPKRGR
jgi:hypothetical protein